MGQTERLYRIKSQLDAGRCLNKGVLLAELGISPATLKHDLAHLRDRMNAPVVFDRERNGWPLEAAAQLAGIAQKLPELGAGARVLGFNYGTGERYLSIEGFLPA